MRISPDKSSSLALRSSTLKASNDLEQGYSENRDRNLTKPRLGNVRNIKAVYLVVLLLLVIFWLLIPSLYTARSHDTLRYANRGSILVSYSYFEKDEIQRQNAEFFWKLGMGVGSGLDAPEYTDFVVVVSGTICSPCETLHPLLKTDSTAQKIQTLSGAWSGSTISLLWRVENEGMDFAAHNVTLEWVKRKRQYKKYRYFIFLNSSVRGPFFPNYMPRTWQWPQAFTEKLTGNVKGVSSSLVCLPEVDAGGMGPKMESWAFALDRQALELTVQAGVFWLRKCKLCEDDEGIVVMGEYGLSKVLLGHGFNIATLMSKYRTDVDWREKANWQCNDQVHPSRHGTYDSISMHPYETLFLKASWHVGEPHLGHYTRWQLAHAQGDAGTSGSFDDRMYRYAISMAAQASNNAADCFKVLSDEL